MLLISSAIKVLTVAKKTGKFFQMTVAAVILKSDELLFEGFLVHQISFQEEKEFSKYLLKYDHTVQFCKKRSISEFPRSCENKIRSDCNYAI